MPDASGDEKTKIKLQKYLQHYAGHMAEHAEKINKLAKDLNSADLKAYISEAVSLIEQSVDKLRELEKKIIQN